MACIYPLDLFLCYLTDTLQLASSFLFSSCCHWQVMCIYPGLHRAQDPSVAWSFTTAINSTLNTNVFLLKGSSMHVRKCWLWLLYNIMWPNPATSVVLQWHKAIFTNFTFSSFENPDKWQDSTWPVKTFASCYFDCVLDIWLCKRTTRMTLY